MILSATGHRPNKLGGYGADADLYWFACRVIAPLRPERVISGMALGWDIAVCKAAIDLGIPVTAAVPFVGQERMWPTHSQRLYQHLLQKCAEVVIVSPGEYESWKMQVRNEWMVDRSDLVLALWNGSPGGTANCLKYCRKVNRTFLNVWPLWSL